jgi:DNA-binding transcriptional ArsR family regulator
MKLEDALCSKTRIKILKVLMRLGQLNTSQIVKKVGENYGSVHKHLEILEGEGILEMTPWGSRVRYYRFNQGSAKALAMQALLQAWEQ